MAPISHDPAKSARNARERGLPFDLARRFEWDSALIADDRRRAYGESRYLALGLIDGRLHAVAFTVRNRRVRVISLRKANRREVRRYEAQTGKVAPTP